MTADRMDELEHKLSELPRDSNGKINMRRIAACINACNGINTEALEDGIVDEWRIQYENHFISIKFSGNALRPNTCGFKGPADEEE
jgi:hypothetical protein